jgi:protein gp37
MGDIAHERMPSEWFARIVEVMTEAHAKRGHVFQCLTKRPGNLAQLLAAINAREPLSGIWSGVSAGDQKHWSERVPWLLNGAIPNCLPWVSVELQLGLIDDDPSGLGWIVIGGESKTGRHAPRMFDLAWAYRLIARCHEARVPVFIKQLGDNAWCDGNRFQTLQHAGTNPAEWPNDLRIRQYPTAWSG